MIVFFSHERMFLQPSYRIYLFNPTTHLTYLFDPITYRYRIDIWVNIQSESKKYKQSFTEFTILSRLSLHRYMSISFKQKRCLHSP